MTGAGFLLYMFPVAFFVALLPIAPTPRAASTYESTHRHTFTLLQVKPAPTKTISLFTIEPAQEHEAASSRRQSRPLPLRLSTYQQSPSPSQPLPTTKSNPTRTATRPADINKRHDSIFTQFTACPSSPRPPRPSPPGPRAPRGPPRASWRWPPSWARGGRSLL